MTRALAVGLAAPVAMTAAAGALEQIGEATTAGSIFSASDSRVHFGLGTASRVDLEIRWPSGTVQELKGLAANQFIQVDEDRGLIER